MRHPWVPIVGWIYGAYLTVRYVDEYRLFPAIYFDGGIVPLKFSKARGSRLIIKERLIVAPFAGGSAPASLFMGRDSRCSFLADFVIGDDVRIFLCQGAILNVLGKKDSSGSGITCQSKVMVRKFIEIGSDVIIAWGVFVTDSDHHPIDGKLTADETKIGDHVWIGAGCQVLKGVSLGKDSIVAAQSVVLKGNYPDASLLAGNPAKVKAKAPHWSRD